MSAAAAHVVLLLIVTTDPSAEIVSQGAVAALGVPFQQPPRVILRTMTTPPDIPAIDALAVETKADSVVILTCTGSGCARAAVRVRSDGRSDLPHTVQFGAGDPLNERGRAIGLLASTLLPRTWNRDEPAPPSTVALPAATAVTIIAASPRAPEGRWGAETVVSLFAGTSDGLSDVGLALGVRHAIAGRWDAGAALKLELGDLPNDAGTLRGFGGEIGVAWTSAGLERPGHFGWGGRVDVIGLYRDSRRERTTDQDRRSALAFGGDAVGLVGYALSPGAVLLAGVGAEILDPSPVTKDDDDPTTTPRTLRLVVDLGILARF